MPLFLPEACRLLMLRIYILYTLRALMDWYVVVNKMIEYTNYSERLH